MPNQSRDKIEGAALRLCRPIARKVSKALFIPLGIHPNLISLTSIFFGISAATAAALSHFVLAISFIWVWLILDCCDGEVARATSSVSRLGASIEVINSNIVYATFWPSLAFGLLAVGKSTLTLFAFSAIFSAIFVGHRHMLANYPVDLLGAPVNSRMLIVASQFKDGMEYRRQSRLGRRAYTFRLNTLSQGSLFEFGLIVAAAAYAMGTAAVLVGLLVLWTLLLVLFACAVIIATAVAAMRYRG